MFGVDGGGCESATEDPRGPGWGPVIGLGPVDRCLPLCLWVPEDAISLEKKEVKFNI